MAVLKKHLTPFHKGGAIHKHNGNKGSEQAPMPNRSELTALQKPATNSINDYAKATPMPGGQPNPTAPGPMGLGSGDWAGNGM